MTKEQMYEIFYRQMATDYSVDLDEIRDYSNYVKIDARRPGTRTFKPQNHIAKAISLHGKFVLCTDEKIFDETVNLLNIKGEWLSLGQNIEKLNEITRPFGYLAGHQHHYYLPTGKNAFSSEELENIGSRYEIKWYEKDDLFVFRNDDRFKNALSFCESAPEMIAVTASRDGKIFGMSGASADSEDMWQIGIDVLKEARGKNIGPLLTILLKEEIMRRGKLPFYGTGESHIQSQKVALKSGFIPEWWEIYSYPDI